jgi:hypothetical protein
MDEEVTPMLGNGADKDIKIIVDTDIGGSAGVGLTLRGERCHDKCLKGF